MIVPITVYLIIILGKYIGFYFLFPKAGQEGWKGLVPFYNYYIWTKVVGRPWWYAIVAFTPIFGTFLSLSMCIDMAKSFNKNSFLQHLGSLLVPFIQFPLWGINKDVTYKGKGATFPKTKRGIGREWGDAIVFAVIAATIIRWSTFEAFMIPTSSLEGTLLAGDYLFVSKMHYGPKTAKTILQVPLTHRAIWGTADASGQGGIKSYSTWPQLPSYRLPGFTSVKRGDIVVFNYPGELEFPSDLRTNYVKRCVATPGDKLEIKGGEVFIDDNQTKAAKEQQFAYLIRFNGTTDVQGRQNRSIGAIEQSLVVNGAFLCQTNTFPADNSRTVVEKHNKSLLNFEKVFFKNKITEISITRSGQNEYGLIVHTSPKKIAKIKSLNLTVINSIENIGQYNGAGGDMFAGANHPEWNNDNYGPITIPNKGMKIAITPENLVVYEKLITYYDNDPKDVKLTNDNKLFIKGEQVTEYTVKQDYYFMMGDNRHNSSDSRYWGFVPEDHIVGTPMLVWFSTELRSNKSFFERIRWDRIFKYVGNE
ncbi:MAG: signal peptidase I [Cyclobacteriaceae bacterium]